MQFFGPQTEGPQRITTSGIQPTVGGRFSVDRFSDIQLDMVSRHRPEDIINIHDPEEFLTPGWLQNVADADNTVNAVESSEDEVFSTAEAERLAAELGGILSYSAAVGIQLEAQRDFTLAA